RPVAVADAVHSEDAGSRLPRHGLQGESAPAQGPDPALRRQGRHDSVAADESLPGRWHPEDRRCRIPVDPAHPAGDHLADDRAGHPGQPGDVGYEHARFGQHLPVNPRLVGGDPRALAALLADPAQLLRAVVRLLAFVPLTAVPAAGGHAVPDVRLLGPLHALTLSGSAVVRLPQFLVVRLFRLLHLAVEIHFRAPLLPAGPRADLPAVGVAAPAPRLMIDAQVTEIPAALAGLPRKVAGVLGVLRLDQLRAVGA